MMTLLTPRLSKFNKTALLPKQRIFLLAPQREVLFGGAAGGGKSEAGLHGGAQYADHPKFSGLILRRRFSDLNLPGALIDRSKEWWTGTGAKWNSQRHQWTFPSGATLQFGYMETENDKYRYQGSEYQYIFFDELTQFTETQYTYMLSRLRRTEDMSDIPLRMRGASNPGNVGHEWVKQRFMSGNPDCIFIPSRIQDNPHLDQEEYIASLSELDAITRQQLLEGSWDVLPSGGLFKSSYFRYAPYIPNNFEFIVRFWDTAATEEGEAPDPDYTVGVKLGYANQRYYILDAVAARLSSGGVENLIRQTAEDDGYGVIIFMEQEPGGSGKAQTQRYATEVLPDFTFYGRRVTGSKGVRARPVAAQLENGNMMLARGTWVKPLVDQHILFDPDTNRHAHDDYVDALSGAYFFLSRLVKARSKGKGKQYP